MTLTDLLPALQNLPRPDKLRAMQFLLAELARDEGLALIPDTTYEIWSPLDSHQAAQTLLESLDRPSPQPTIQSNHSDRWFATLPKRIDPLEFQRSIRSEWDD
jgi:hypothetical protein